MNVNKGGILKLRIFAGLLSLLMLMSMMTACSKKEAVIQEGAIYVTETESFWVGIGAAYLSFEYKEEPQEKEEDDTSLYGKIFYVLVDSGDGFAPWLAGTWELEEGDDGFGKLVLIASWNTEEDNQTMLADAESGVAKEYEPKDGKYEIGVAIPSADVTFNLDPVANKVELTSSDNNGE